MTSRGTSSPADRPGVATREAVTEALTRAGALSPWLVAATSPPPPEAPSLAVLASDGELLADVVARAAGRLETDRLDVAAGLVFHDLAWRVIAPALAAGVVADVAPRVRAAAVTVVFDERGASTAVHVSAADGHAGSPAPHGRRALLRAVRDDAVATLSPLVTAFRPHARRGAPSLWGEVADTIASALQSVGELVGRAQECRAAADDLLDGSRPIRGRANWVDVDHAGVTCTWRTRNACCKAFELPAYDYCAGCPMLGEDDRRTRFEALNEAVAAPSPA